MQILITNNESFQIITIKNALSNAVIIKKLDNNKSFRPIISIKRLHSSKKIYISKNRNNNKLVNLVISTKYLRNCKNKHINKDNKNNDLRSQDQGGTEFAEIEMPQT